MPDSPAAPQAIIFVPGLGEGELGMEDVDQTPREDDHPQVIPEFGRANHVGTEDASEGLQCSFVGIALWCRHAAHRSDDLPSST